MRPYNKLVQPLPQKEREKGSGDQPIPEWYHSPGILGNGTLSVLSVVCLHPVLSKPSWLSVSSPQLRLV